LIDIIARQMVYNVNRVRYKPPKWGLFIYDLSRLVGVGDTNSLCI
jgi:hypothetical protein